MKKIFFLVVAAIMCNPLLAQVPALNSHPSASSAIYLDFDGEYIAGTGWNFMGPIDAQPSGLDEAGIREVFERVSEDYRIFNINVTTDPAVYAAAPAAQRIRVLITVTHQWYWTPVGGTSFVHSFRFGNNTPAWVFSERLGFVVKNIAEAAAHEAGHALGLQHQSTYDGSCGMTAEYSTGQGTGEIGWAPIMGIGYDRNMTTWHTGTNSMGCNVTQNDILKIADTLNGFGLRTDDHGDTHDSSTEISLNPFDFTASGMINNYADRDVFKITLDKPTNIRINAVPQNVGAGNNGANIDIKVGLLSYVTDTIGKYNPTELLNAGVDTNLNAGTYYIVVDGVANQNLPDFGSVGSYALEGFIAAVLPIHRFILTSAINDGKHQLNWAYKADEPVKKFFVEMSKDGRNFTTLATLPADATNFSWVPLDNAKTFYRIKLVTVADERSYYSNANSLKSLAGKTIDIASTFVTNQLTVNSKADYPYQLLDETGRLLQFGTLRPGTNNLNVSNAKKGIMLLRVQDGIENSTFKIMKQ